MSSGDYKYIWQASDWPNWHFDLAALARPMAEVSRAQGLLMGRLADVGMALRDQASLAALTEDVVKTSEIEGEQLNVESVRSSIARRLGVDIGALAPVDRHVEGVVEMVLDATANCHAPVSRERLYGWHAALFPAGYTGLSRINVGTWRNDASGPMQVVSGPVGRQKVHFEAPPAADVPEHMKTFVSGLARSAPSGPSPLPPLTRAGLAHIWFESIHPYEDGNGRIGRAISEKLLAQERPTTVLTGISGALLLHRKAYYAALERAHSDLDITEWLLWFGAKAIEAQRRTLQLVDFVLAKARLMNSLHGLINARQERVLLRMFNAGPAGFRGGLSAANYMSITGAPTATTTRDLSTLVAMGALLRTGNLKSTRYQLNIDLAPVNAVDVSEIS